MSDQKIADTRWFYFLSHIIMSGEWAQWSGSAKAIYPVIKSLSDFKDGKSSPSYSEIQEKSGLSRPAVASGLKDLEERGHIKREKKGQSVVYSIIERVPVSVRESAEMREIEQAIWTAVPAAFQQILEEVKKYTVAQGNGVTCNMIKIEKIADKVVVNVNMPGSKQVNVELTEEQMMAKEILDGEGGGSLSKTLQIITSKKKKDADPDKSG